MGTVKEIKPNIDEALSRLIVESINPLALEVALNVQQQLQERLAEADRLRRQVVEREQYEAEQARIRYMRVDPNHRLVADTLEALWNDKLRHLEQTRQEYEKQRQSAEQTISQQQKAQILALAEDFPRLWKDPATSDRDRKRMARLILEDVTLHRDHTRILIQVRFKGGATKVLSLLTPPSAWQQRKTKLLVDYWRQQGLLKGIRLNDKNEYLYEWPHADAIHQIKKRIRCKTPNRLDTTYEAQYETNSVLRLSRSARHNMDPIVPAEFSQFRIYFQLLRGRPGPSQIGAPNPKSTCTSSPGRASIQGK